MTVAGVLSLSVRLVGGKYVNGIKALDERISIIHSHDLIPRYSWIRPLCPSSSLHLASLIALTVVISFVLFEVAGSLGVGDLPLQITSPLSLN